jgi:hypothetical protein
MSSFQTKTREMFEDFYAFWLHMTQATKYNLPTVYATAIRLVTNMQPLGEKKELSLKM